MAKSKLFKRRYIREYEQVSRTEKLVGAFILVLVAGIVATFAYQVATDDNYLFNVDPAVYDVQAEPRGLAAARSSPADPGSTVDAAVDVPAYNVPVAVDNPFPDPDLPDWRGPARVFRYTPDNLYVKINGRADIYLQFNVVSLTFGTYRHATARERTVDVYWYDMGEPDNALGIYRTEASPGAEPVAMGREGYTVGGAVFFRKGSAYVQVLPMSIEEGDKIAARKIAERIAGQISAEADDAWALKVLPESGRVADTFAYLARDAFSLDFLSEVYTARYDVDGERLTVFVHRAADGATAAGLFERYVEFFQEYGRITWRGPDPSRRIAAGEVAGVIDVIFAKGRYLGGVAGADNAASARTLAVAFYDELTAP